MTKFASRFEKDMPNITRSYVSDLGQSRAKGVGRILIALRRNLLLFRSFETMVKICGPLKLVKNAEWGQFIGNLIRATVLNNLY